MNENIPIKSLVLKKAGNQDISAIHEMQVRAFKPLLDKYSDYSTNPAAESAERIAARMFMPASAYYLITSGEETVGVIRLRFISGNKCKLSPLFIAPEYQGRGFGSRAIELAEEICKGSKSLEIDTIAEEPRLVAFYEANGFVKSDEIEEITSKMHLVFMRKPLV